MNPILAVGSVAFDSIKTPFGEANRVVGGAATYFAIAASFFTEVRIVAVVGEDFGANVEKVFGDRWSPDKMVQQECRDQRAGCVRSRYC